MKNWPWASRKRRAKVSHHKFDTYEVRRPDGTEALKRLERAMHEAMGKVFLSPGEFKENPATQPCVWHIAENHMARLIPVAHLNELFDGVVHRRGVIRLLLDGSEVDPEKFTHKVDTGVFFEGEVAPKMIAHYLDRGATLVINSLARFWSPLREFQRKLTHESGMAIETIGFLTSPGAEGFAAHQDNDDVLVCQVSGKKRWRIYKPFAPDPFASETYSVREMARYVENTEPFLEVTIGPGDCLWLPRGWVHAGVSEEDEYSWHVSIAFSPITYRIIAEKIISTLAEQHNAIPHFRGALPWGATMNDSLMHSAVVSTAHRIKDAIEDLDVHAAVENVQRERRAKILDARQPLTTVKIDQTTYLETVPEAILTVSHLPDGGITLHLAHKRMRLSKQVADFFLDMLVEGADRGWLPSDLVPRISEDAAIQLAQKLQRAGIVRIA